MGLWRGAGTVVVATLAALLWSVQADAQGSDKSWMNAVVGSSTYASNEPTDRELIKEGGS